MSPVLVACGYRFVLLDDCSALRQQLHEHAARGGLKGTVLLATEGINFNVAGTTAAVTRWLQDLQADVRFAALELKTQPAQAMPFKRLLVKVKAEIIRMNQATVQPANGRAPAVDAPTLARWLDAGHCDGGRPLLLLDTRNAFEVDAGRFSGAIDWRLQRFSDFPAALASHHASLRGATVVTYCTGGIRCEKAALWMAQLGLPHVLQLDGGILGYFDRTQGAPHWQGNCFVFDERAALAPDEAAAATAPPSASARAAAAACAAVAQGNELR